MKKLRICLQPNCNAMPQDVWGSQFVMQPTLDSTISRLKYKDFVIET
jgi:hypothetical protein